MGSLSSMTQAVEVTVQGFLQLRDACARTGLSMEELSDAIGKLQLAAGKEWDVVVEEPDVEPFRLEPRARRGMMLEGDIPCR